MKKQFAIRLCLAVFLAAFVLMPAGSSVRMAQVYQPAVLQVDNAQGVDPSCKLVDPLPLPTATPDSRGTWANGDPYPAP